MAGVDRRGFDRMFALGDPPDYEPDPSTSIAAAPRREGRDAASSSPTTCCSPTSGRAFLYVPLLNYADGNLDAAGEMLAHPNTVLGLGRRRRARRHDLRRQLPHHAAHALGARPRPGPARRCRSLVAAPDAATPPRTVGLLDRGVLAPGYRADVNVIDFDRLHGCAAPRWRYDLPAGGKRLVQRADGYVATLVAGEVTYERRRAHRRPARPAHPRPAARTDRLAVPARRSLASVMEADFGSAGQRCGLLGQTREHPIEVARNSSAMSWLKPLRTTTRSTARSSRLGGIVYAGHQPAALAQLAGHVEDVVLA